MKRLRFLILLLACFQFCFAQSSGKEENTHLESSQVPAVIVQKFNADHPGVTPVWKADGENYKASFNDPASKLGRMIIYNKEGKVMRTENEVDQAGYPKPIGEYYEKNYPGEKYQVWSSEDTESGQMLYYSGRNLETIWFDRDGTRVPERKAKNNESKPKK